jgi:hypothetical protein
MFPFWLILGIVTILIGIFNRQLLRLLGFKPASAVIVTPNLKRSSRDIEQIGRLAMITLGAAFFVVGLGDVLPGDVSNTLFFALAGLIGLMIFAMIGISILNWKAR